MFKNRQSKRSSSQSRRVKPSYYSSSKPSTKPKEKLNFGRVGRWLRRLISVFILLAAIAFVIIYGLLTDPTHPRVVASSIDYHSAQDYLSFIKQQLNSPLNHSKLTFASANLKRAIEAKFPEVTNVDVELPILGRDPVIRLDISPIAILLKAQGSNAILVSGQGRLVGAMIDLKKAKGLIKVNDQSGVDISEGGQIFSTQQVSFLKTVAGEVTAHGLIASFSLPATAQEVDMHIAGQVYTVKMDMGGDGLEQTGAYLAAKHYFLTRHHSPAQYLDVRVDGKVFFK